MHCRGEREELQPAEGEEVMEMMKGMERIKKNEEKEEKQGLSVDRKPRNLTGGRNAVGGGCFSVGEQKKSTKMKHFTGTKLCSLDVCGSHAFI